MNRVKVVTAKAIGAYGEVEIQLHSFLSSKIMAWVVSFRPQQLYSQRNINQYPVIRKLLAPQYKSEPSGKETNFFTLPGIDFLDVQLVAYSLLQLFSFLDQNFVCISSYQCVLHAPPSRPP